MKDFITICDGCPCLNKDYEAGSECNLWFNTDLGWFKRGDKTKVLKETLGIVINRNENELYNYSLDCELINIRTDKLNFSPERHRT